MPHDLGAGRLQQVFIGVGRGGHPGCLLQAHRWCTDEMLRGTLSDDIVFAQAGPANVVFTPAPRYCLGIGRVPYVHISRTSSGRLPRFNYVVR
ncbi:hypothetical protein PUN4_1170004 [Paraburkholderia unamae]|nr:hypothetical protein PUN4_1170004 [Paraburkholderia unamae]